MPWSSARGRSACSRSSSSACRACAPTSSTPCPTLAASAPSCTQTNPSTTSPGIPVCTGQELTERLLGQISPFAPQWHLGQQVDTVQALPTGGLRVGTTQGTQLQARAVFIATGVGAFVPRTLKLPGLDAYEGGQLLYRLDESPRLAGQRVVVHGGDEPAVQQAIACATAPAAQRPARTTLQHRRDVFDAPPALLEQLQALRTAGRIEVAIGMASRIVEEAGRLTALELTPPRARRCTCRSTCCSCAWAWCRAWAPSPNGAWHWSANSSWWTPPPSPPACPASTPWATPLPTPGKRKLILSGFHEATLAAFGAAEWLAGHKLPLEYTTSSERLQGLLGVAAVRN